jgi:hypothetical protein
VKEPLKAPFIFLFMLIVALVVLSALNVLAAWGMHDAASRRFNLPYAVEHFPRSMFEVLIPSVIVSIMLLGMRMARRPFSRFLGLLITLAVSYVALVNGMLWMRSLATKAPTAPAPSPAQYVQPGTFLKVGPGVIEAGSVSGARLQRVLFFNPTQAGSRFSVSPAAAATLRGGTLTVTTPRAALSGDPGPAWSGVFAADRFTAFFLRDIDTLVGDFTSLLNRSLGQFFAACFALLFLCTASLALLRVTRWPLANIMLLACAVRGYFSLYHLLAATLAPRVTAAVSDPLLARMFPSAALAVIGVILLLVDILFIPADRWTAEETQ